MVTSHRTGSPYRNRWHLTPTRRAFLRGGVAAAVVGGMATMKTPLALAAAPARPGVIDTVPAWFTRDVRRMARWLPSTVKTLGIEGAYRQRWNSFPIEIQDTLRGMSLPSWLIALVPTAPEKQEEIYAQFRFIADLSGAPPANPVALRAEQLLVFGGAAQLPTPGDKMTGASLGAEGCTAAMSKYVLAQLKAEFPVELAGMSDELTNSQSSSEMQHLLQRAERSGIVRIHSRPFAQLRPDDIQPGSLTIAQKPGGTHVFGWTRVPTGWNWYPGDKMAIGNTGLPQYGDHMILAQEYVTADTVDAGDLAHNSHGPINSRNVIYARGRPDLSDPRTNVYAVEGSHFILVNLV